MINKTLAQGFTLVELLVVNEYHLEVVIIRYVFDNYYRFLVQCIYVRDFKKNQ